MKEMTRKPPIAERRFRPLTEVEFRGDAENSNVRFRGHASVFDEVAEIAGVFRERVDSKAFKKTLDDGADVRFLINHDPNRLGARTKSGTLRLGTDSVGLGVDADLDRRQTYINDLQIAMERGDLDQMSYAFRALQEEWEDEPEDGGLPIRTIKEAQLFDVSPVTFPAFTSTDAELVAVRALAEVEPRVKQLLEERAEVDNSAWDGNAAMTACDSASCYRAICAGRKAGDPDERSSWALPHHKSPGSPPNAAGVRNALARIGQTQGLTNKEAAQSHLDRHMSAINPDREEDKVSPDEERDEVDVTETSEDSTTEDSTARNEPPETEPSREDHSLRAKALIRRQRLEEIAESLGRSL